MDFRGLSTKNKNTEVLRYIEFIKDQTLSFLPMMIQIHLRIQEYLLTDPSLESFSHSTSCPYVSEHLNTRLKHKSSERIDSGLVVVVWWKGVLSYYNENPKQRKEIFKCPGWGSCLHLCGETLRFLERKPPLNLFPVFIILFT